MIYIIVNNLVEYECIVDVDIKYKILNVVSIVIV